MYSVLIPTETQFQSMCLNKLLLLVVFSAFVVMCYQLGADVNQWISSRLDLPATHWPHKHSRVTSSPLNVCKRDYSSPCFMRVFVFTDSGSSDTFNWFISAKFFKIMSSRSLRVIEHNCIVCYDGLHWMSYLLISSVEDAVRIMFIILNARNAG